MIRAHKFVFCGFIGFLAACNTTPELDLPVKEEADVVSEAPASNSEPLESRPLRFQKAIVTVRYGTPVVNFPAGGPDGVDGTLCNYTYSGSDNTLNWAATTREFSGWDDAIGTAFYDVMNARGFDLAGDPDAIFDLENEASRTELAIGARIEEIRGNACEDHHWWDGRPLNKFSGEMYQKIKWDIVDLNDRTSIASFRTEGYARQVRPKTNGLSELFVNAFASASEALAANPDFIRVVSKGAKKEYDQRAAAPLEDSAITLPEVGLFDTPFRQNVAKIRPSVVAVRSGLGHGSGFVISEDGYVLTNWHVVGEAETAKVILNNGITVDGAVIRRHKVRDVALIKVALGNFEPTPISDRVPHSAEPVFVIGSPLYEEFNGTLTSGVVSRRFVDDNGLAFIQSDVTIHGGNSGGPLFDEFGNVVGITVSGIGIGGGVAIGLNNFIPISDALEYLNLRIDIQ